MANSAFIQKFADVDRKDKLTTLVAFAFILILIIYPFMSLDFNAALLTLLNGIFSSSLFLGISIGFSLIFGIAKQFKLSIGGYYVISAYLMFMLLEIVKITPDFNIGSNLTINLSNLLSFNFDNLIIIDDKLFLLLLAIFPFFITILIVFYFYFIFPKKINALMMMLSPFIASIGIFILTKSIVYSAYTSLAVCLVGLSLWYIELSNDTVARFIFLLSFLIPLFNFVQSFITQFILLMFIVMIFVAIIAMISDRFLLDRIRHSVVDVMIITFALALIIQSLVQILYFPKEGIKFFVFRQENYSLKPIITGQINFLGVPVDIIKIVALIIIVISVIMLILFINYSRIGLIMKAVSQDEEASELMGINIRKVTAVVSGIGISLLALSSIIFTPFTFTTNVSPFIGWQILIITIAVVTLGGIGSLNGTIVSAIIIGFTTANIGIIDSSLASITPLLIVFIIMIIKPSGLYGTEKELE